MSPKEIIINIESIDNNHIFIGGIYPQNIVKCIYNNVEYIDRSLILQSYHEGIGNYIIVSDKIKLIYNGDVKFIYITTSINNDYEISNEWKKVKVYNNHINIYNDLTVDSVQFNAQTIIDYNIMNKNSIAASWINGDSTPILMRDGNFKIEKGSVQDYMKMIKKTTVSYAIFKKNKLYLYKVPKIILIYIFKIFSCFCSIFFSIRIYTSIFNNIKYSAVYIIISTYYFI